MQVLLSDAIHNLTSALGLGYEVVLLQDGQPSAAALHRCLVDQPRSALKIVAAEASFFLECVLPSVI